MTNKKTKNKYRCWDFFDILPDGFKIDKLVSPQMHKSIIITNEVNSICEDKNDLLKFTTNQEQPNSNQQNKMIKDTYKFWDVYDELPDGWKIDKTCGSPMARSVFITDGVPPLYGCKRAILRLKLQQPSTVILDTTTITPPLPTSVQLSNPPTQYSLF